MIYYLTTDQNGYLISASDSGTEDMPHVQIDSFNEYDFEDWHINAYFWNGEELVFDQHRYDELKIEHEPYHLTLDNDGYLLSVSKYTTSAETVSSVDDFDFSGYRINAYRWNGATLVFDSAKFEEIMNRANAMESQKAATADAIALATERLEAQVTYTAMMTDTLLEEE